MIHTLVVLPTLELVDRENRDVHIRVSQHFWNIQKTESLIFDDN